MKIAQALLLRKQLEAKVRQLEPLKVQGDNGVFDISVERVKISDEIEEARIRTPKISMSELTKAYDHYATELRKIDASIQQANWQYDVEYTEVSPPETKAKKKK